MEKEFITVRAATTADIPEMWGLLHCEGRSLDEGDIAAELESFYVLSRGTALLGVYFGGAGGGSAAWAAVHPLFGQDMVEDIMAKAVNGLIIDKYT